MRRYVPVVALFLVLLGVNLAQAAGLGVEGDGFLTTYGEWIPTLLFLAMLCGIGVWVASGSDYGQGMLSGSVALFSRGVVGGGAVTILGALGLTMGGVLS